jgi:hypothetical protein
LHLLRGLKNIIHFVDDVISAGENAEQHLAPLAKVFEKFREGNLEFLPEKVNLFQPKIKFLGVVVTQGEISPDPDKIKCVANPKTPRTMKELRGILGLTVYFRNFVLNYAQIAKPLTELPEGKSQNVTWSQEAQISLDRLKKELTSEPVLSLPDFENGQFLVTTDISSKGIDAILSQIIPVENPNPLEETPKRKVIEKIICYSSRTLCKGESSYCATNLELLSIIHHLDKFRHYLIGRKFILRSDHKSSQYLRTLKNPTGILARWIMKIQDLDYEFEYLKGKQNAAWDFWSRFSDNMPSEAEQNEINAINIKSKCKKNKVKETKKG